MPVWVRRVVSGLVPRHGAGAGRAEDGTGTAPAAAVEAVIQVQEKLTEMAAVPSDRPGGPGVI